MLSENKCLGWFVTVIHGTRGISSAKKQRAARDASTAMTLFKK
jgi:hypothetical protein